MIQNRNSLSRSIITYFIVPTLLIIFTSSLTANTFPFPPGSDMFYTCLLSAKTPDQKEALWRIAPDGSIQAVEFPTMLDKNLLPAQDSLNEKIWSIQILEYPKVRAPYRPKDSFLALVRSNIKGTAPFRTLTIMPEGSGVKMIEGAKIIYQGSPITFERQSDGTYILSGEEKHINGEGFIGREAERYFLTFDSTQRIIKATKDISLATHFKLSLIDQEKSYMEDNSLAKILGYFNLIGTVALVGGLAAATYKALAANAAANQASIVAGGSIADTTFILPGGGAIPETIATLAAETAAARTTLQASMAAWQQALSASATGFASLLLIGNINTIKDRKALAPQEVDLAKGNQEPLPPLAHAWNSVTLKVANTNKYLVTAISNGNFSLKLSNNPAKWWIRAEASPETTVPFKATALINKVFNGIPNDEDNPTIWVGLKRSGQVLELAQYKTDADEQSWRIGGLITISTSKGINWRHSIDDNMTFDDPDFKSPFIFFELNNDQTFALYLQEGGKKLYLSLKTIKNNNVTFETTENPSAAVKLLMNIVS